MNYDDRIHLVVYGQNQNGHECVICLANDYDGELIHKRGCDEVFHFVKGVRNGVGLQLPHRPEQWAGPGPSGGQGEGMYYERGQGA